VRGCSVSITEGKGLMKYDFEMASCGMIHIPSFTNISTGVRTILRFCLRSSRGCNVGITDGKNLLITPLRWAQMF
jgi:hypothetical protein